MKRRQYSKIVRNGPDRYRASTWKAACFRRDKPLRQWTAAADRSISAIYVASVRMGEAFFSVATALGHFHNAMIAASPEALWHQQDLGLVN